MTAQTRKTMLAFAHALATSTMDTGSKNDQHRLQESEDGEMIMLSRIESLGRPDELVFVNPQHIVWVRADESGEGSVILFSTGYGTMHVADERNEIVDMIEAAQK